MSNRIIQNWNRVIVAMVFIAMVAAVSVRAATITSANDFVTTLRTSQAANHRLLFTTSTGVAEGSTITITFASGFTTSSITEDDVDIADDGSQLTTAATCGGTDKASVGVSSNIVTITICAGDGGAIAASSQIEIKVGTNATSSGTGLNQITNSSSAGTYFVTVGGTFGDSGSIALPIALGSDLISVTATVPVFGGGGSEGGDAGDNTGNQAQVDSVAPVISNVIVSGILTTAATVNWNTDENANSKVSYGLTSLYELGFVNDVTLTKSHSISLNNLQEGKTYYFQVKSADASNNIATSSSLTFSTLDQTAPLISNVTVSDISKSSAKITWNTNEGAKSTVEYGLTNSYGSTQINETSLLTTHSFTINGLTSASLFHFRVKSKDASTNESVSSDQTFQTLVDLPPANVAGLTLSNGDKSIVLVWTNPDDNDLIGVRILRCLSAFPTGPIDTKCQIVSDNNTLQTFSQNNLTNGITYYFGVFAKDSAGQFASGALAMGKPSALEKEVPSTVEEKPVQEPEKNTEPEPTQPTNNGTVTPETKTETFAQSFGSGIPCGDGVCSSVESAFTCPIDCKKVDKSQLGTAIQTLSLLDIAFSVGSGVISLPNKNGYVEVLPQTQLNIRVQAGSLGKDVDHVSLVIGSDTYLMRPVTDVNQLSQNSDSMFSIASIGNETHVLYYEADVISSKSTSLQPLTVFVEYKNGISINVSSFLRIIAPGDVKEIIDGEETPVIDADVKLFSIIGSNETVWDGSPFGESNPIKSSANGSFTWYVPNGNYRVRAEHNGYISFDSGVFPVSNSIVNPHIVLKSLPKKKEVTPETAPDAVISGSVIQQAMHQVTKSIRAIVASPSVQAVSKGLETVRSIPVVQQAADISLPTLAVTAGTSVVVLSVTFDFLPFIQYFFTAPVLLFWRRKRKAFGIIYNAISKEPIGLAVVRLFVLADENDQRGKLVKSRVTDKGGRFFFLVQPGLYRLVVTKNGFTYPTELLSTKKEDLQYLDVYHGEPIRVTENDAVITPNVPLDPSVSGEYQKPKQILLRARLRMFQHVIAISGVILSLVFAIVRPNVLAVAMVFIQVVIYFIVRRLAQAHKPKSWGIVYSSKTGRPLANVVARIFEPKYNKLLETQVTDTKGRYSFLLGPGEYYAVFEKNGYESEQIRPIDYTKEKDAQDFSKDLKLHEKIS